MQRREPIPPVRRSADSRQLIARAEEHLRQSRLVVVVVVGVLSSSSFACVRLRWIEPLSISQICQTRNRLFRSPSYPIVSSRLVSSLPGTRTKQSHQQ